MDACFTKQLVNAILIIALCKSGFSFEIVEKGTKLYQKEQTDTTFYLVKDDDGDLIEDFCFCSFFTLVCRYCTGQMFCNNQKSGCCPLRGSDNNCGTYCVPPTYTCCNNNGACGDNHPTCCNDHCCGKNNECCGKRCCSENWKCCKKDKNKHFCILEQNSPGYCEGDGCVKQNENEFEYFSDLCSIFAKKTRLQNDGKTFQQFAVLTLNKVSESNTSPIKFGIKEQQGNYVSAPPKINKEENVIEHAEERILKGMKETMERFESDKKMTPYPPNIYLFTFSSPCLSCVEMIISTKNQYIKGAAKMFVGWQLTYDKMSQGFFFLGLEQMMDAKITIVYSPDRHRLCGAGEMSGPDLVQPTLLEDLLVRYEKTNVDFCEKKGDLRSSFIKLINLLVWECRWQFDIDGKDKTRNNVINCMTQQINGINPKINPCIDLSETIKITIVKLFESKNRKLLLSPPLDPDSEKTSISNRLTDLTANYKSPYLCFQVKYKSVKG